MPLLVANATDKGICFVLKCLLTFCPPSGSLYPSGIIFDAIYRKFYIFPIFALIACCQANFENRFFEIASQTAL